MENWHEKSKQALQLSGKDNTTQVSYTRAVRLLIEHFNSKSPDLITEEELQEYFLHCRNKLKWAPNTMRICYAGIRFFFENVLRRDWHILSVIRAQREHRLPTVLTTEEVRATLAHVTSPGNHAFLSTVYSCGLRLQEALHLEVTDIDKHRMMIHVQCLKSNRCRHCPVRQVGAAAACSKCFISRCRISTWHAPDSIRRFCFTVCCWCGPAGIICAVNAPVWPCAV